MEKKVKGRSYDATARRARSAETRRTILDSASRLVLEKGYRATTIAAVAVNAGVNVDTVYELVGRKPVLFRELIEQAISGTDQSVIAEERDYVKAMLAEPDPTEKLAIYARALRKIHARLAPLFLALREASATEPEALQVWQEIGDRRASNMRKLAKNIRETGALRPGLSIDEAADVLWATNSAELYVMLTAERGWSSRRYERWLADAWCRLLLR